MAAYYNEHDPKAAAWLRELITANLITDGEVDERSIVDVHPGDVRGFAQCHFFAGIGGWSCALRLAGWSDERSVWTGSCPCQPWSQAGQAAGENDPRHLWPAWFRLVRECRPAVVFGEQVASDDGLYWLDLVYDSLEAADYAVGAVDLSGACVGSPDIRPRLWFVADTDGTQLPRESRAWTEPLHGEVRSLSGMVEPNRDERQRDGLHLRTRRSRLADVDAGGRGAASELGDADVCAGGQGGAEHGWRDPGSDAEPRARFSSTGLLGGFWSDADWIYCSDEKWRPVEPGAFPLADGIQARMGRLRGYGNAIKPQVAAAFIEAYMSIGQPPSADAVDPAVE